MAYRVKIEVDGFQCLRCGYQWVPRIFKGDELPTICPKCKSPYWNKERKFHRQVKEESKDETRLKKK
jgi:predicted Zn-ribbon and HTH transcriptional regulator